MKTKKNNHSPEGMSDSKKSAHYAKPLDAKTPSSADIIDRYFPKGDKRRGDALVLMACSIVSERQRILRIINEWGNNRFDYERYDIILEDLKKAIEQGGKDNEKKS